MLARIRKIQQENEGGFTLIELLVVVVIIGILAAIAIPTFLNQREKAWERAALSDLRNASVKAEEAFSDNGTYPANAAAYTGNYAVKLSDGVGTFTATGSATTYCLQVTHTKLAAGKNTFVLNATDGKAKLGTC